MRAHTAGVMVSGLVLALLLQANAYAVGLGFYGGFGLGAMKWEDWLDEPEKDADTAHVGVGFIFDTAVSKRSLFNYRLSAGYERRTDSFGGGKKVDLDMYLLDNMFGFAVVRSPGVRFWIGPEVRVSLGSGQGELIVSSRNADVNVGMWNFGVGPALGMNLHMGETVSLCFTASLLYTIGFGDITATYHDEDTPYDKWDYEWFSLSGLQGDCRVALIFRIREHHR